MIDPTDTWTDVAPESLKRITSPAYFLDGELIIDVPDSATLYEADRIMREDWDWEFHLICECPQVRKVKLRLNPLVTA